MKCPCKCPCKSFASVKSVLFSPLFKLWFHRAINPKESKLSTLDSSSAVFVLTSRTSKWKEVIMLESFPYLFALSLIFCLCLTSLSLCENSNLRLEQTLRTCWEALVERMAMRGPPPPLFFTLTSFSSPTWESVIRHPCRQLHFRRCTHEASVYAFPPFSIIICLWNFFICSTRWCSVRESFGCFSGLLL